MATHPLVLLVLAAAIAAFGLAPCTAENALSSPENGLYNALTSPDSLYNGQSLDMTSYHFTMQTDCNLVLYNYDHPIWATNTGGRGSGCRAAMQDDGNLVVYDEKGRALWASGTSGEIASYALVMQKDRNVVIYGPSRWSTGTRTGAIGVAVAAQNSTAATADAAAAAAEQVTVSVA